VIGKIRYDPPGSHWEESGRVSARDGTRSAPALAFGVPFALPRLLAAGLITNPWD
jgi:hypothetical protein